MNMGMKYYKRPDSTELPYAYAANGSQDAFILSDLVLMSNAEVQAHIERVTAAQSLPADSERQWRDAELSALIWLRDRHRDQLELGAATTLTPEQFAELLEYMQQLRDWPQSVAFPDSAQRPVAPPWIAEQTQ
ncbi:MULTISPECIES: phage tail assembly chaperone [Pseudomonas]|uniref:phage tail assembly chaperone n=1 Tax=Pseudomonas TaxID=286 RepID=UPI002B406A59|nr:phage tail assembly chaperone [Pseudomonas sichuanensis]